MGEDPLLERIGGWCADESIPVERFEDDAVAWGLHLRYPPSNPKRIDVLRPKDRSGVLILFTGVHFAQGQVDVLNAMNASTRQDLVWDLYMFLVSRGVFSSFHRTEGILTRIQFQRELFFDDLDRPSFLEAMRDSYSILMWLISAVQRACGAERGRKVGNTPSDEELPMFR